MLLSIRKRWKALSAAAEYYEAGSEARARRVRISYQELKPQCLAPAMTKEEKMEKRKQDMA